MIKKPLLIICCLLVAVGCDRYIDSRDPVRSLPEKGPVPYNLSAEINDRSVTLAWEAPQESNILRYRVYLSDSTGTKYTVRDSSSTTTATISNLGSNQLYYFKVASVWGDGQETPLSDAVTVRVAILALSISGDAEYTNTASVQVRTTAPSGTTHIQLSEDQAFAGAIWGEFSPVKTFELSTGDGVKTVYARLQFSDGSQSGGQLSDDIILDTEATIESVSHSPSGVQFGLTDTIRFELTASDIEGQAFVKFGSVSGVELSDDGFDGDAVADDKVYSGFYVVPIGINLSNVIITGAFHDKAGNTALQIDDPEPVTIFTPPLPVNLTALVFSTYQIDLTWPASNSSTFASYRIYRSVDASVSTSSELVVTLASRSSSSYRDTALSANTEYFYKIYVYETSGLSAGSNVDSATTIVNTPPEAIQFWAPDQTDSTATFVWTASNEPDFATYRIYRRADADVDTTDLVVSLISNRSTTTYTYNPPLAGTYFFRIYVFDRHGEATGSNNSILVQFTN